MPISLKTDLEWGDVFYLKNDADQFEHLLIGVVIMPGKQVKLQLSYMGEVIEVWDFECSKERDTEKMLSIQPKEDD